MFLGFLDSHTIYTIIHLIGVALGAGGAYMSDLMFFSSIKDEKISPTELRFMRLGSKMVWIGIIILVISGSLLFSLNVERYLTSGKFLAKMTIVAILIANGAIFHLSHIPRLHKHVGAHFPSSDEFVRKSSMLIVSGVISVISWTSALILGALGKVPYGYWEIMAVYLLILGAGIVFALIFRKRLLPLSHKRGEI